MARSRRSSSRRRIRPDDLLQFVFVSDPQLSPDGKQLLMTRRQVGDKNEYVGNLWIVETSGDAPPRQFSTGERDGQGRWSPDGRRVAFVSGRQERQPQLYLIELAGGEARRLTQFPEGKIGSFRWSPDGSQLAVTFRETDPQRTELAEQQREESGETTPPWVLDDAFYRLDGDGYFGSDRHRLYLVDTCSGRHRLLFSRGSGSSISFDWAPDGSELIVATNLSRQPLLTPWRDELVGVSVATGKVRKIAGVPEGRKSAVRFSPDGSRVLFAGREGRETWGVRNTHLFSCHPDGSDLCDLTGHTDYCLSAVALSDVAEANFDVNYQFTPDGRHVLLNFGWHGDTLVATVPLAGGPLRVLTSGPGAVALGNTSADGRCVALCVADATHLPEAAVAELRGGRRLVPLVPRPLTNFNGPLLSGLDLSVPREHWIPSTDGTRVQTWIMLPPRGSGRKARKPRRPGPTPAVLEIHGGPHALYGTGFFHEFQVLAAAGLVVVFSNPRGSKGYGEEHCMAIQGRWGQADWEDIEAVTRFMQQSPLVDARRMGVTGGSYGGYMTNWVITHTDVFAAAITDRCVSNLVSMAGSSDYPLVPGEYWPGNPWDDNEEIWRQSPIRYIRNARTPTLVIHSEGDLRCNVEQGEQIFAALKILGVPTRFVRYPRETSHGMSRSGPPDMRLHRLDQILEWWNRYL